MRTPHGARMQRCKKGKASQCEKRFAFPHAALPLVLYTPNGFFGSRFFVATGRQAKRSAPVCLQPTLAAALAACGQARSAALGRAMHAGAGRRKRRPDALYPELAAHARSRRRVPGKGVVVPAHDALPVAKIVAEKQVVLHLSLIHIWSEWIAQAREAGIPCYNELELGFQLSRAPFVAVTGKMCIRDRRHRPPQGREAHPRRGRQKPRLCPLWRRKRPRKLRGWRESGSAGAAVFAAKGQGPKQAGAGGGNGETSLWRRRMARA